jgi:hypothetical protein
VTVFFGCSSIGGMGAIGQFDDQLVRKGHQLAAPAIDSELRWENRQWHSDLWYRELRGI